MISSMKKVLLAGAALLLMAGCGEKQGQQQAAQAAPPPAVGVETVKARPVAKGDEFIGRVEATSQVDILARVEGFLEAQHFIEGQEVKKGDLLYTIEKDMFQAQVDQFSAQVVAAQANLANAEIQYQRDLQLVKQQYTSQSTVDKDKAARDAGKAQVLLSQAQLEQARINLGYTDIYSPVDGKVGEKSYDVGNLVSPSSKPLVTVVTQDPMYVTFPVSQEKLQEIRESRRQDDGSLTKIEFVIRFPDGATYPHTGRWNFTSPQVVQATDTVLMRATVPNPERQLIDGQYVKVVLQERHPKDRLVIPQAAVQTAQGGTQVLVVGKDNKVGARIVELGQTDGADYVVTKGLQPGERVIVEGLQKVKPGGVVTPTEIETKPPVDQGQSPPASQKPATGEKPATDEKPAGATEQQGGTNKGASQ